MEARVVEEREAQRQRIEELVGFVSTLGAAMGRTMPASLVLPLPQAATPVSTTILLIMFQLDIGHTRKNMQSQTYNMVLVVTAVVVCGVVVAVVVFGWWWCWWRCIDMYVLDGHRAVCFLAGVGNLSVQGRFCRNFLLTVSFSFFSASIGRGIESNWRVAGFTDWSIAGTTA
jgi:hypothetical protein